MENDLDELANILSEEDNSQIPKCLQNGDVHKNDKSEIHNGDTDSSDDEDNKYAADQRYTDNGRDLKNILKKQTPCSEIYSKSPSWKSKSIPTLSKTPISTPAKPVPKDVFSDPFFGIRIVTPLISSQAMKERMAGKTAVRFSRLEKHLITFDKSTDWVLAGVIVSKFIKTSQKGKPYACWTLSDLRDNLPTVSIFLFGKAYKDLWKTSTHVVVAILNPTPLENKKSSSDIAVLSVLNSDQVMIWGQSKDLGVCKARKKNGEPCTSFINKNQCEFCIYHVKQEYRKFTSRSELQASSGGSLNELRNKVIGKNEVFYAGKSYTAIPGKPNKKQVVKDKKRLSQLFNSCESRFGPESLPMAKKTTMAQSSRVLLMKDAERLQKLTGSPVTLTKLSLEGNASASKTIPKKSVSSPSENSHLFKKTENCTSNMNVKRRTEDTHGLKKDHDKGTFNTEVKSVPKIDGKECKSSSFSCNKKQPTKNRFENLVKLKSVNSETNDSFKINQKCQQTIDSSNSLKPGKNLFDVSFEFDERENVTEALEKTKDSMRTSLKNICTSNSSFNNETKISREKSSNNSITTTNKQLTVSASSMNKKSHLSNTRVSPTPLGERKSPTKCESRLNISHKTEQLKPKKQSMSVLEKKSESVSPEFPVKRVQDLVHTNSPKLGQFSSLNLTVPCRTSNAKAKALKYIKTNGPIQKEDPNVKKSKGESPLEKKRKRLATDEDIKVDQSVLSQRFKELMNMTSRHEDLISAAENEAMDNYYEKMEKKEQMEEKMLSTYKVECKAFRCLKCKYKWFSPSERCKTEKHPIKMISAVKRFFQCNNCKNRTVTLEIIPLHPCGNCGQSNWQRAPMMRERKSATVHLSIRGGEQKFVNSVITDTNLDLLIPDDA